MSDDGTVVPLAQAPDAIELRHLRAFVAVAGELNFSRAAQGLFLSQPALSRQIRHLERLIGCDLFRRSTQRVELTLAGESLLARARPLLADLDNAITTTRSVGGELDGRMARLWAPWTNASEHTGDLETVRAATEELHGRFAPPDGVVTAPVLAGGTPALRLTPATVQDGPPAAILYVHGGGHVAGSAFGYRHLAGAIAAAARTPALVVDYRLAPEHPYPTGLHDVLAAYRWLLGTGTAPDRITVTGDSSGAGLVLSLLLALRAEDLPQPAGAALMCPWVDLTGKAQQPPSESPILFRPEAARRYAEAYLDGHPEDDPLVDPLHTGLSGLPPLLIHAASGDSVRHEAQLLAEHAGACGVEVATTVYPVATHTFHLFWSFLPEAAAAVDQIGQFIRDRISATAATDRAAEA
ncbi:alpha/beta hydrolase fold domain-containing protein [Amycolatopsis minnesotensis]|uniref:HTH lysR-type domain-containing protein n=1 Tax=Amycolatopsis minnesotensis TaxID=337894 RepID=A0ABN2QT70_9PSEU